MSECVCERAKERERGWRASISHMIAKQFGEGVWINAVRSCRKQNKTLARPAIEDKMKPQLKVTEFRVNEFCLQAVTLDQQYRLPVSSRTLPYRE